MQMCFTTSPAPQLTEFEGQDFKRHFLNDEREISLKPKFFARHSRIYDPVFRNLTLDISDIPLPRGDLDSV
jgi:hypothetical protein